MMIDADKATIQDQDKRPDHTHNTRKIMVTTDSAIASRHKDPTPTSLRCAPGCSAIP